MSRAVSMLRMASSSFSPSSARFGALEDLVDDRAHAGFGGFAVRIERERAAIQVERAFARRFEILALVESFLREGELRLHGIRAFSGTPPG